MKGGSIAFVFLFVAALAMGQTKTAQKKTTQTKTTTTSSTSASSLKASIERGQKVYATFCLTCHQVDGGGVPKMNPPLIKTKWVLGDKKELVSVIIKGMKDPIEIEDEEYHNPMPPHAHLTDQQIADVLTFVRNNFGNKASAVSASEVKGVRAKLK
jgi:mono/diheme cytochrome c family protein